MIPIPWVDRLNAREKEVLLSYPVIVDYLKGRRTREEFLEEFGNFEEEIKEKLREIGSDLDIGYLKEQDFEDDYFRKKGYSRFVKFARRLKLDTANLEEKIAWIKSVNAEKFLDVFSISGGLLKGLSRFIRWRKRKKIKAKVAFGQMIALEPPDNSLDLFKEFFLTMQRNISTENARLWEVKLYFAIICAHIFPDGNGRVARNAYFLLRTRGLLSEEKSASRGNLVTTANIDLLKLVAIEMLGREGVRVNNYDELLIKIDHHIYNRYAVSEEGKIIYGYVAHSKYIAAKRTLERRNLWERYKNFWCIPIDQFSEEIRVEYETEYQKVLIDWFWTCIKLAEVHYNYFAGLLDEALLNN